MTTQKARIGFIGAGWWATANHMAELAKRPDVDLTAVCRLGKAELNKPTFPISTLQDVS